MSMRGESARQLGGSKGEKETVALLEAWSKWCLKLYNPKSVTNMKQ